MDGKQSLNELGKLEMELSELRQVTKALKKDTDKYNKALERMRGVRKDIKKRREELGLEGMTLQQLVRYQRDLRREITNTTTRGTKDYEKLRQKLVQVTAQVTKQRMEMRGMTGAWVQLGQSVRQSLAMFGPVAAITSLIYGLGAAIRSVARDNITLSDTMADVQKNTELTNDELAVLMDRLENLDTRTSKQQLLELVTIGGKLGIRGVQDLEGFASAADKINVALGEDLGGDPITTLRELGKLTNTFKLKQKFGIEDSLLRVGSVLNDLGRSSEANEERIADFTKRMGPMAAAANISIEDIMGLGAAADLMGLSMEVAGTATSQIIGKMVANRSDYVQFARDTKNNQISLEDFTTLLNTDTNEALLSVLRGLNGNNEAMTDFIDSLGDMGLEGQRVRQVIAGLAGGIENVTEQQGIAKRAFEQGNSVIEEFNQKNQTAGANLAKIGKAIKTNFINSGMVRWLERVTAKLVEFIEVPVSEVLAKEIVQLNMLHIELKAGNTDRARRLEIINSLQKQYPGILGNINAETISNDELSKKLKEVNEQLINRIVIAKKEEEIAELNNSAAERKLDLLAREDELKEKMAEIANKYDLEIPEGETLLDQAEAMQEFSNKHRGAQGIMFNPFAQLGKAMRDYNATLVSFKSLNQHAQELVDEKNSLKIKLFGEGGRNSEEQSDFEKSNLNSLLAAAQTSDFSTPEPNLEETPTQSGSTSKMKRDELDKIDSKGIDEIKDVTQELIELEDTRTGQLIENSKKRQAEQAKERALMEQMIAFQVESSMQAGLQAESWKEAGEIMKQQLRELIVGEISRAISIQITKAIMTLPIPPPFNLAVATGLGVAAGAAINQAIPSFYYGGEVGETGHGMGQYGGDKYGNFSGMYATHGGEFTTPAWVRGYPDVQAAIGVTKARMNGTTMTTPPAPGSVNVTSTLDASGMDSVATKMEMGITMFADLVNVLREHGIEAKISKRESARLYETGQEEYAKKESARDRGRI